MTDPAVPVLALDHATRRMAGRIVVDGMHLAVARGEVLGLLGVNGAGKSTTLRMMAGVLAPDAGSVRLEGADLYEDPRRARQAIGYLPEVPPLHGELTTQEFLAFCARLHGVSRAGVAAAVARAIERCGLGDARRRLLGTLSKGLRQRVGLAQAIVHEPALIVLDEPASGLDPVQAANLRGLVRSLGRSHAIVLSTHVLADVPACCDRVAIVHQGQLRHAGPAVAEPDGRTLRVQTAQPATPADWAMLATVASATALAEGDWRVRLRDGATVAALAAEVVARFGLVALAAERAPLEQVFLAIAAGEPLAPAA